MNRLLDHVPNCSVTGTSNSTDAPAPAITNARGFPILTAIIASVVEIVHCFKM